MKIRFCAQRKIWFEPCIRGINRVRVGSANHCDTPPKCWKTLWQCLSLREQQLLYQMLVFNLFSFSHLDSGVFSRRNKWISTSWRQPIYGVCEYCGVDKYCTVCLKIGFTRFQHKDAIQIGPRFTCSTYYTTRIHIEYRRYRTWLSYYLLI